MRAVRYHKHGGPEQLVLEEVPSLPLKPGSVRIRTRAIGLNFAELVQVAGQFQIPAELPAIPGFEVSGEVMEVAKGLGEFEVGDRVMANLTFGAYAEEVVLPEAHFTPMPVAMTFEEGAAFPVAYGTAHLALLHRGGLKAGETVLIHGATGNVGGAAVEVAKRVGARVIAVGESERIPGSPDFVVERDPSRLAERVNDITKGHGADVVLDLVGGKASAVSLDCVAWEGRLLAVGFASGVVPEVSLLPVLTKNISLIGEDIAGYAAHHIGPLSQAMRQLVAWYEEEAFESRPVTPYPFEQAGVALQAVADGSTGGKLVLVLN